MKHLLIDFDSTIPNLALMKISAWGKSKGDEVYLNDDSVEPDEIWLSCIFTWNKQKALDSLNMYKFRFPNATIHYGGTGFDFFLPYKSPEWKNLPQEIEDMEPDYHLYNDDRAVGFCQRGCNRKCQFCVVHRKEGRISENKYKRLKDWAPEGFKKILLLDNDIALADDWKHNEVLNDAQELGLKLSITQGYDIRCVTPERAQLLAENKPYDTGFHSRNLYFSWDYPQNEPWVRRGIEILKDAGFKGRELTCYVLVGFNSTHDQDMHRINVLWNEYGVLPYVMAFNNDKSDPMIRALVRWVNKREIFKSTSFEEYSRNPDFKTNSMKYVAPLEIDNEVIK